MKKRALNNLKAIRTGLFFVWPWLIGLALFNIIPFVLSLYYSFTSYSLLTPPMWVGLDNFRWLMEDDTFKLALWNTFYFVIIGIPLTQIAALMLAIMLHSLKGKVMGLFRAMYYFPTLVPGVVMALIWSLMMNSNYGIFNFFLEKMGISAPLWFEDPAWAKFGIILLFFWGIGGGALIYLAALNDVPKELYEAALIDGANAWSRFIKITVPMISPAIFFNVVTGMIGMFQIFTEPYIITGGGPDNATLTVGIFIYNNAFKFLHMGYASAAAWILFIIIFGLTLVALRVSKKTVYYRGG